MAGCQSDLEDNLTASQARRILLSASHVGADDVLSTLRFILTRIGGKGIWRTLTRTVGSRLTVV